MKEMIRWFTPVIMGVVLIVVILILHNSVNRMFAKIELNIKFESDQLAEVVVTLADMRYHRPGCDRIRDETRRMTYEAVRNRVVKPCPYCFPQDFKIYMERDEY